VGRHRVKACAGLTGNSRYYLFYQQTKKWHSKSPTFFLDFFFIQVSQQLFAYRIEISKLPMANQSTHSVCLIFFFRVNFVRGPGHLFISVISLASRKTMLKVWSARHLGVVQPVTTLLFPPARKLRKHSSARSIREREEDSVELKRITSIVLHS